MTMFAMPQHKYEYPLQIDIGRKATVPQFVPILPPTGKRLREPPLTTPSLWRDDSQTSRGTAKETLADVLLMPKDRLDPRCF